MIPVVFISVGFFGESSYSSQCDESESGESFAYSINNSSSAACGTILFPSVGFGESTYSSQCDESLGSAASESAVASESAESFAYSINNPSSEDCGITVFLSVGFFGVTAYSSQRGESQGGASFAYSIKFITSDDFRRFGCGESA